MEPKRERGGQPGNRNARRHYRYEMPISELPKGYEYINNKILAYRRKLEDTVLDARGTVSYQHATLVNAASEWEKHRLVSEKWFRAKDSVMTIDQRLNCSREGAKAANERNKCIRAIGLDHDDQDLFASLHTVDVPAIEGDSPTAAPDAAQPPENNGDTPDATGATDTPDGRTAAQDERIEQ